MPKEHCHNQRYVRQQHCFLQNKHETECSWFGGDKGSQKKGKGHWRGAVSQ